MKIVLGVVLSHILVLFACQASHLVEAPIHQLQANQSPSTASQAGTPWRPAVYRGLTMGKSTRAEMLRVLGKPVKAKPYKEGAESGMLYGYEAHDEISGELVVTVDNRTGVIRNIEFNPRSLSEEQAIKHFGGRYEIRRYDFDLCLGDGESAPLYESPTGNLRYIEYRSRGIALLPNENGKIDEIKYVSEPIGAVLSKCKERTNPRK